MSLLDPQTMRYLIAAVIIVVTPIIAKLILHIFERYLEPFASSTKTNVDYIIIKGMKTPVYILTIILGLHMALRFIDVPWLKDANPYLMVAYALLLIAAALRIIPNLLDEYGHYLAKRGDERMARDMMRTVTRLSKMAIIAVAFIAVLGILKINLTPLVAGMGVAGVIFALAAHESLSNMFAGFYLMVDKPFRISDRLILGGGEIVEVRDVGIRSTKFYNVLEHTLITMPNAELAKMTLTNISEPDIKFRLRVPIGVAYGSDVAKVKKTLLGVARETEGTLEDPPPIVIFEKFGDFSLNFQLIVWIQNVRKKLEILDGINTGIDTRFKEEEIEIPFPITTVHVKS